MSALPNDYDFYHRCAVQKALNEKTKVSPALLIDGAFGAKSAEVLKIYQKQCGVTATGIYDAATQAQLEPFIKGRYVLLADFQAAADELGVELAAIQAVAQTESKGSGFFTDGSCAILFERHWMYNLLRQVKPQAVVDGISKRAPESGVVNPVRGGYLGGIAEYKRLELAMTIDRNAALQSASWGMFQIMGFNYRVCGFNNAADYVAAMKQSELLQLKAFVSYIKLYSTAKWPVGSLKKALKDKNWNVFAEIYNGPAQVADYAPKMAANYQKFAIAA